MSLGKLMTKKLKNFDSLGEGVNFTINDEPHLKTVCGGVLRLILYIIGLLLFILFGKDFLLRKNPRIDFEIKESLEPLKITYSSKDFFFALRFENFVETNIDISDYFHLVATHEHMTYKENHIFGNFSNVNIPIVRCSEKEFDEVTEKFFASVNKSEYFCPDIPQNQSITISGSWFEYSQKVSYFNLHLRLCLDYENPVISEKKCKNYKKFFDNYLNNDDLYIRFITSYVKFEKENHETPLKRQMQAKNKIAGKSLKTRNYFYFSKTEVLQDDGVLFAAEKTFTEFGFSKADDELFYFDRINNDNEINKVTNDYFSIFIFSENIYNHYTRKYVKFQNVLALLSTFMNLLTMIAKAIYSFYYKFRLEVYFFKKLVRVGSQAESGKEGPNFSRKFNSHEIIRNSDYSKKDSMKEFQYSQRKLNISDSLKEESNNSIINHAFKNNNIKNSHDVPAAKSFEDKIELSSNKIEYSGIRINNRREEDYKKNVKIEAGCDVKINLNNTQNKSDNESFYNKSASEKCMQSIFDGFAQAKNPVKLSFWEHLKISLIYKDKAANNIYYLKSEEFFKLLIHKFDVFYYLKKMRNLSLLKKCLLAENELSMLNFISNKCYSSEYCNNKNNSQVENKSSFIDRKEKLEVIVKEMYHEMNQSRIKNLLLHELSLK